jgi:hypothetical protein
MRLETRLTERLLADPLRVRLLEALRTLALPDAWIGAGFVRDAVWDDLHARPPSPPAGDVDVVWFDARRRAPGRDRVLERRLCALAMADWSVRNQARMHTGNGDAPYRDVGDAVRFWPETATAVAVRLRADGGLEVVAPYGLDDLFAGLIRPTPRFCGEKRAIVATRMSGKRWLERWPLLRVVTGAPET